jgi:hypothetical protein
MKPIRLALAAPMLLLLAACDNPASPGGSNDEVPASSLALPGQAPENVLAARIAYVDVEADSARVFYQASGEAEQATPFRATVATPDTISLLGLRAATSYGYRVEVVAAGVRRASSSGTFRTADLPADLTDTRLSPLAGKMSGYALAGMQGGLGGYAVAFDSTGTLAWYRDFTSTGLQVSNVMRQPNGNFTAFIGNTAGWQAVDGYYAEFTPAGAVVRSWRAPAGTYMDNHEFALTGSGASLRAHFATYSVRTADLTALGGRSAVMLAGHQIVRTDASGLVEFTWDGWEHLGVEEWVTDFNAKATRAATDFDHPNAVSFDPSGNYIVSWRNLSQVMALDPSSGNVLWRIGGAKGEYRFLDDPDGGFSKQHSAKVLSNGDLLVYDNGTDHTPQETRVVEYRLDHQAKTATLVWQYRHSPAIWTEFVGWTERLASGNTWVAFAGAGRVVEVTPAGQAVWEGQMQVHGVNAGSYRIVPARSLY